MDQPRHFLVRARRDNTHVRVSFWAGTALQRTTGGRPNLGELCMTPDDWTCLKALMTRDHAGTHLTIEDHAPRRTDT